MIYNLLLWWYTMGPGKKKPGQPPDPRDEKTAFYVGVIVLALILMVLGAFMLFGCGTAPVAPAPRPDGGSAYSAPDLGDPDGGDTGPGGGGVPIGYYERQCQWDACGGPKDWRPPLQPLTPNPGDRP